MTDLAIECSDSAVTATTFLVKDFRQGCALFLKVSIYAWMQPFSSVQNLFLIR